MKSNLFRIFTVVITVVSISMMGAALATFFVHPDLASEINTPAMQNFTFEKTAGETPQWTVTRRYVPDPSKAEPGKPAEKGTVGTYKTPYEALTKAHQDLKKNLMAQTGPLVTEKQQNDENIKLIQTAQTQDSAAVMNRLGQLKDQVLPVLSDNLQKLSEQQQALSVTSRTIREETASRRTDVLRLQRELEEARTDLFRLTAVRLDLTDRLVRLEIENQSLKLRQAELPGQ